MPEGQRKAGRIRVRAGGWCRALRYAAMKVTVGVAVAVAVEEMLSSPGFNRCPG
jgi:hypothetical protein